MAINLWKIGTGKTSYSPLPTGFVNRTNGQPLFGNYTISFRASSPSSAVLRIDGTGTTSMKRLDTGVTGYILVNLTSTPTVYTFTFNYSKSEDLFLYDQNSAGNIIIDSISLVQAPLQKLTVNGFDGIFELGDISGSDGTLLTSSIKIRSVNFIAVQPNTTYTISKRRYFFFYDANKNYLSSVGDASGLDSQTTFTTPANCYFMKFTLTSTDITSQIMLNLGSTPAPYSKKTGDKMVMPTPKKNLIPTDPNSWEQGSINGTGNITSTTRIRTVNYYPIAPNTTYSLSFNSTVYNVDYMLYNGATLVTDSNWVTSSTSFTTGATVNQVRLIFSRKDGATILPSEIATIQAQLELGSVATAYMPYAVQANKLPKRSPKANTGLSFNGVTDYLQLPSMTMDKIVLDCNIDSNQLNSGNYFLLDARSGLTNGYISLAGSSAWSMTVDNISKGSTSNNAITGKRSTIVLTSPSAFTDDLTIFTANTNQSAYATKGILYKVTCYLNGAIVAQYDFTNTKNIVGNTVIPNAQNLIPNFEDSRWSLHANAKVMGKDVLHLDATGSFQISRITFPILSNTNYQFFVPNQTANTYYFATQYDANGTIIGSDGSVFSTNGPFGTMVKTFTTDTNARSLKISAQNNVTPTGSYDFIRPQLYQLDGTQGTINGSPKQLNKQRTRLLYAKR